jgi:hypothetical protein
MSRVWINVEFFLVKVYMNTIERKNKHQRHEQEKIQGYKITYVIYTEKNEAIKSILIIITTRIVLK